MHRLAKPSYIILTSLALAASSSLAQQAKHALTFDDFAAVRLVSDPQISPDGRSLLYALRTTDVEANRRLTYTMLAPVGSGNARRFPNDTTRATEARWSPDGSRVAYIAGGQLWVADARGGNASRLTNLIGGASGPIWSPTGAHIAFVSAVTPSCSDDACNRARETAREESKVKAYTADQLMYRHWTAWDVGTRSHLFIVQADGSGLRDLTSGARYDVPVPPFGGSEQYGWAPDGREIAYSAKDATRDEAWSTDVNVYVIPITGGTPRIITAANKGADQNPVYTPDGRFIAYASQQRAGFESDRWRLMFFDRVSGSSREMLPSWDRFADTYFFPRDMRAVYLMTQDRGRDKLFRATFDRSGRLGTPQLLIGEHNNTQFSLARDGATVAWIRDAAHRPHEVFVANIADRGVMGARQFTHHNDSLVSRLQLNAVDEMWTRGALGDSVHSFILRPPQWEPGKKFPVILLIHGGPQGAWLDTWHSRWNYQLMAAPGYGLVIVNPRGSTGYGQAFLDSVTKNWGDEAYTDLMQALDGALARNGWMDSTKLGATGGSYGGYMTNWIAGHTNRFDALVTHAGVFNLEAMYGATEELWFTDWEFGGPWWDSTAMATQYRRYSPHLFAGRFESPMLVLHGELDYRVPYTEGLSLFTALQRRGVPSRLVVFPDEGHWILKPQNQRLWWREVQGWFGRYLGTAVLP